MQELQHLRKEKGSDENHSGYRTQPEYPTNAELARDYFLVNVQFGDLHTSFKYQTVIARAPVDIAAFYALHGSLKDLAVPDIGDDIKNRLELILQHGVDEAKRILGEK